MTSTVVIVWYSTSHGSLWLIHNIHAAETQTIIVISNGRWWYIVLMHCCRVENANSLDLLLYSLDIFYVWTYGRSVILYHGNLICNCLNSSMPTSLSPPSAQQLPHRVLFLHTLHSRYIQLVQVYRMYLCYKGWMAVHFGFSQEGRD